MPTQQAIRKFFEEIGAEVVEPPGGDIEHIIRQFPEADKRKMDLPLSRLSKVIPRELTDKPQWVLWKAETRNSKLTKIPYQTNDRRAKSNDPMTWTTFIKVMEAYESGKYDGIGFVLSSQDPFVAFDLDKCRDAETKKIADWAQDIVNTLQSYTEITPSNQGLRVIVKAKLLHQGRRKGNIEIYDDKRFITVTGSHLSGTPATIENRERETHKLHTEIFGSTETSENETSSFLPNLNTTEIIKKAREAKNGPKFSKLWQGDWSDYPSQSEADQALCSMLAFWVPEPTRIDSLFRLSGLYRDKWDERHYSNGATYGQQTVENAINNGAETYRKNSNHAWSDIQNECKLTDLGNAKRLVKKFGNDIRYCYRWKNWLVWDGKRWQRDNSGKVMQFAKATITDMYQQASSASEQSMRTSLASWAIKSESQQRLEAMVKLARSEPGIPIDPSELDRDNMLFNVLNGTLDLTTGGLSPHSREDFITRLSPVNYDPTAKSEVWASFLQRNVPDPENRSFLQRVTGYALTGDTSEEKLFFIHGPTRTGKSTYSEAIKTTMGDYARTANFDTFIKRKFERNASEDIARLVGSRFVTSIEVDEGKSLAEQLIKTITGGDTITARALYESSFEFKPSFKLFLVANNRPKVKIEEEATWNRIIQIPFCERLSKNEIDKEVKRKLIDPEISGSAILAWAVKGCLEWQKIGLQVPDAVQRYTDEYKDEMNPLKEFFEDCCLFEPDGMTLKANLRKCYIDWCVSTKEKPIGRKQFPKILESLGIQEHRTGSKRFWKGIRLIINDTMT